MGEVCKVCEKSEATFTYKSNTDKTVKMITKCLNCAKSRKSIEAIHELSHSPEYKLVSDIILRIQDYIKKGLVEDYVHNNDPGNIGHRPDLILLLPNYLAAIDIEIDEDQHKSDKNIEKDETRRQTLKKFYIGRKYQKFMTIRIQIDEKKKSAIIRRLDKAGSKIIQLAGNYHEYMDYITTQIIDAIAQPNKCNSLVCNNPAKFNNGDRPEMLADIMNNLNINSCKKILMRGPRKDQKCAGKCVGTSSYCKSHS